MKGIISDIQRFALHDGPGIRTTLFLKGCPFSCVWCSNPETLDPKPQLAFDENKCNQCLDCISFCPTRALTTQAGKLNVNFDLCDTCGKCIEECPTVALKIYGREVDSDDIITEVLKDIEYFKNSSGGITLSGGDPLFQFDFALDILKKAKRLGINTCIETEGFGSRDHFSQLIPLTDYFYFDYKITDDIQHKHYTGVSNKPVLKNLEYLCRNNAFVVLRCVIIPGINDKEEHFRAIAELSQQFEAIKGIHVMPYHNYGISKYKKTGQNLFKINSGSVKPEISLKWVTRINELGGKNVSVG